MKICIVGTSRCGTTLLRSILNKNPAISFFNETHWIPKMYEFFGMQSVDWRDMLSVAKNTTWDSGKDLFTVNLQYSKYEDVAVLLNDFEAALRIHNKVNIQQFSNILADILFDSPVDWGDKTPDYGYYMDMIQQIFPDCKFIHVTRDGLATARSMSKHSGCQLMISGGYHNWCSLSHDKFYEKFNIVSLPMTSYIKSWAIRMNRIRDESKRLKKNSYMEISYENILNQPKKVLEEIECFAQLPATFTGNDISILGINKNKLKPATELTSELVNLTPDELRLLNNGYGKCYFKEFASVQELYLEFNKAKKIILSDPKDAVLSCISLLASPLSQTESELELKTKELLNAIKIL